MAYCQISSFATTGNRSFSYLFHKTGLAQTYGFAYYPGEMTKRFNPADKSIRIIILILFFFSGASALIYQIVWVRQFGFVFGVTVFAISTVLTAFMAGLALGSIYFGRLVDKGKDPLSFPAVRLVLHKSRHEFRIDDGMTKLHVFRNRGIKYIKVSLRTGDW